MKNINQLFKEYLKNKVNLDSEITKNAIECRENLLKNIAEFDNEEGFFDLHSDFNINFGSFSRKTKCRELDDIDMMIGISANGAKYDSRDNWDNIEITASTLNQAQIECTNEDGTLNSRKVLERFKSKLEKVREYSRSEIKRNYEAIVLNLKTKTWNFDIVPCFQTVAESYGRNYYLIPNGNGNWKKTDPRIDKNKISDVNQSHGGKVLNLIRLTKKWNSRNNNIKKEYKVNNSIYNNILEIENYLETTNKITKSIREILFNGKNTYINYVNIKNQKPFQSRDEIMADRISFLAKNSNSKIIVWAHNAHISNEIITDNEIGIMGRNLKKEFNSDYYTIGLTTLKGSYSYIDEKFINGDHSYKEELKTESFQPIDSLFWENRLSINNKSFIIDMTNLKNELNTDEIIAPTRLIGYAKESEEDIYYLQLIKNFDSLIFIEETNATKSIFE